MTSVDPRLINGYGGNLFTGSVSTMMYLFAVVSLSLVAKAFGSYAAALIEGAAHWLLGAVSLRGAAAAARAEIAIGLLKSAVLLLFISLAVFGLLTTEDVIAAGEGVLAAAAWPLVATASAINASLYATPNTTYQMAKDGELPRRLRPRSPST